MSLFSRISEFFSPLKQADFYGKLTQPDISPTAKTSVVVPFPPPVPAPEPLIGEGPLNNNFHINVTGLRKNIVFDLPDIREFFDQEYITTGRNHGAVLGITAAKTHGKDEIIAAFQIRLHKVIFRMQAKQDMLNQMASQITGMDHDLIKELQVDLGNIQRDINRLQEQIEAAGDGRGWISGVLAQYELGFLQGVRARIDFCTSDNK